MNEGFELLVSELLKSTGSTVKTVEAWLGLEDDDGATVLTSIPLSGPVYKHLARLMQQAWGETEYSLQNPIKMDNPDIVSLDSLIVSVRATGWLYTWMEMDDKVIAEICRVDDSLAANLLLKHVSHLSILQTQCQGQVQLLRKSASHLEPLHRIPHYQRAQNQVVQWDKEWEQHMTRLETILGCLYVSSQPNARRNIRRSLGRLWQDFLKSASGASASNRMENTKAAGISLSLKVLNRILQGMPTSLQDTTVCLNLLTRYLLPMHAPNSLVLWRDQTPILELYHEPLVQCISCIVQRGPMSWIDDVIVGVCSFLNHESAPTAKQVLLLHELETYVSLWVLTADKSFEPSAGAPQWYEGVLRSLRRCMLLDNSRISERALQYFQDSKFVDHLVTTNIAITINLLVPGLVSKPASWNPTVRKRTWHVLNLLRAADSTRFDSVACKHIPRSHEVARHSERPEIKASLPKRVDTSLQAGMGSWRPPSSSTKRGKILQPPSTIAGIAPWASAKPSAPPSTVTGVAPWASQPPATIIRVAPWVTETKSQSISHPKSVEAHASQSTTSSEGNRESNTVDRFMTSIKPPSDAADGTSLWSKSQLEETPTLLPNLKFHDLVFGHDLGSGAFSVVRYARHIDREKTRSFWPEYAVKIISTEKIRELNYEASVQREIAVLSVLSHPGIARLVSTFRFQDGAYMVLEYASRGDLHTLIRESGSLDLESTRFVIGEVAATLSCIHDKDFVYGDLKPENIVITESGHVKLTDFGGCRPVSKVSSELVGSVSKGLLKNLRDGGHSSKRSTTDNSTEVAIEHSDAEDEAEQDLRVEGTTAYLSPEVVMGSFPTKAADSWSLGCVLYQCLAGRPPLMDVDDGATRRRIVTFAVEPLESDADSLFSQPSAANIEEQARGLIRLLLSRDAESRPTMEDVASHEFFNGVDIFQLHRSTAPRLDAGTVTPAPDATWTRRQLSSIWAPQPAAYKIDIVRNQQVSVSYTDPIPEGEEAGGTFMAVAATSLPHVPRQEKVSG